MLPGFLCHCSVFYAILIVHSQLLPLDLELIPLGDSTASKSNAPLFYKLRYIAKIGLGVPPSRLLGGWAILILFNELTEDNGLFDFKYLD